MQNHHSSCNLFIASSCSSDHGWVPDFVVKNGLLVTNVFLHLVLNLLSAFVSCHLKRKLSKEVREGYHKVILGYSLHKLPSLYFLLHLQPILWLKYFLALLCVQLVASLKVLLLFCFYVQEHVAVLLVFMTVLRGRGLSKFEERI